jgi:hypothetical protein
VHRAGDKRYDRRLVLAVLKINLLPKYIYERRKVYRLASIFGVVFIAIVFGMFAWWFMLGNKEIILTGQVDEMELKTSILNDLQKQVDSEKAKLPPVESKVKFMEDLMAYNVKVPQLYEELAKYTYARILYKSVTPAGSNLTIQAHAGSLADCGRYLMNMYRATHIFNSVTISAVPGWSGTDAAPAQGAAAPSSGFDFTVTCALVNPIAAPAYAAPAAGGEGAPGPGGAPAAGPAPGP